MSDWHLCPFCHYTKGACPECGKQYLNGRSSHCRRPECKEVNAPLDCKCGRVLSADLDGVIDLDGTFHPFA